MFVSAGGCACWLLFVWLTLCVSSFVRLFVLVLLLVVCFAFVGW